MASEIFQIYLFYTLNTTKKNKKKTIGTPSQHQQQISQNLSHNYLYSLMGKGDFFFCDLAEVLILNLKSTDMFNTSFK